MRKHTLRLRDCLKEHRDAVQSHHATQDLSEAPAHGGDLQTVALSKAASGGHPDGCPRGEAEMGPPEGQGVSRKERVPRAWMQQGLRELGEGHRTGTSRACLGTPDSS